MPRRRLFRMPKTHLPHIVIPVFLLAMGGCDARPTEPEVGSTSLLVAAGASVNSGATERTSIPIDLPFVFQCSDDGPWYQLQVSGYVDVISHSSIDGTGGVHASVHWNPHVVAVDQFGRTYLGGYSRLNLTVQGSDGSLSHTQMIRLIGMGTAPNLHLHLVDQRTVNGKGEVSVDFDRSRITCSS